MAALPIRQVEKPWGKDVLPAPFAAPEGTRIGEIWFEPPPELPELLVKYIFTSEKLSVQVHPSDAQTLARGMGRQGKEECWLIVAAEPGATLGIGFDTAIGEDELRAAALDGSIEDLMTWHAVKPGDFFYIPANTVHAIGAGVSLIEVQQNSDITYRLFDYGRPRELHLDQGMTVARGGPHDPALRRSLAGTGNPQLVDGPHFRLDRVDGQPDADLLARYAGGVLIVPLAGSVSLGDVRIGPGECGWAASLEIADFSGAGSVLVVQPVG